ncbi:MAG: hypothetical protein H6631_05990 [Anaerolineaceae bacterium]|nr:hypothetical protein [Anaerolineaceae bacterium]
MVCEALGQAGAAVLPYLSGPEAAGLGLALARLLDRHGQPTLALAAQTEAVAYLRADDSQAGQQRLSVALYNQAGYLAQLDRLAEAVAAMAEVVAIDERLGLDDLASDRAALEAMRRQLAGEPPPAAAADDDGAQLLATLQAALAQAPPEAQAQLRQMIEQVSALSPAEQAAYARELQRREIEAQAGAIVEAAIEARQAGQVADLLPHLAEAAAHYADGAAPGSPYADLAQFVRAVAALLQGQAPEPVAPAYVERLAEAKRRLAE